jgi:hypothetical protein
LFRIWDTEGSGVWCLNSKSVKIVCHLALPAAQVFDSFQIFFFFVAYLSARQESAQIAGRQDDGERGRRRVVDGRKGVRREDPVKKIFAAFYEIL